MATAAITRTPIKFRHELKHSINGGDDILLSHRLNHLFSHDENAGSHGCYRVCSLYFDTPYDKAFNEKVNGVNCREKFRLRHYNGNTSFIRLEKKLKKGGLCGKYSTPISMQLVQYLLQGELLPLLDSGDFLLMELYSKMKGQLLRPKTIVTYDREAFTYRPGNVRITIDRNLCTGLSSVDFLASSTHNVNVSDGMSVLEVKYDAFLPELVRKAVQVPNRQQTGISKYAICRRHD